MSERHAPSGLHDAALQAAASASGIPLRVIAAIVFVESSGDPHCWRVEPPYRYLWDVKHGRPFRALTAVESDAERAPPDFPWSVRIEASRDTEWRGQQASWGPMQVMGAVAREYGYDRPFPRLCSWDDGLAIGCRHLLQLRRRFDAQFAREGWVPVIAAYNAGSPRRAPSGAYVNQEYVDKVIRAGALG